MSTATLETGLAHTAPSNRFRSVLRLFGLAVLLAMLVSLAAASLALGNRPMAGATLWNALWHPGADVASTIVWHYRVPRTALAMVVGCALGVAGALMQALTRNPLADPGLLGINAGASLAVVLAMSVLGLTTYAGYVGFALAGAAAGTLGVHVLAGRAPPEQRRVRLLLAGTALSACLGAGTAMVTLFDVQTFDAYRFWIVGSLDGRGLDVLQPTLPLVVVGVLLAVSQAHALDAMSLGEDMGRALGQRLFLARAVGYAGIVLLCGAATAAAGPIGFVGLMVPHMVRLIVGPHWRWILAYAMLAGPVLVLGADVLGRVIARPDEIEAGIVTAVLGAPVLLALVLRRGETPR